MTDINKIAEAPSGEKTSLDGTEKVPLSGSKWALISRWAAYLLGVLGDTDITLAANSDSKFATQKAIKTFIQNLLVGLLRLQGNTDCSGNPNYPAAVKGDAYYVTTAGKIGGASGASVDIGDVYACKADNAGGTQGSVGTSWFVIEHNLTGALLAANNLSDVASASTARTNLGLGTAATHNVPASGNASSSEVVLGSDTRLGAGAGTDTSAIHVNEANEISTITEKTTLADDDLFIIEDSAASGVKKKVKKSNVATAGTSFIMNSRPYGMLNRQYPFASTVEGWTATGGTLSQTSGYLHYVVASGTQSAKSDGANIADLEFICDFRFVSGTDGGICWRYVDDNNYYMILISGTDYTPYKRVSGGYTALAGAALTPFMGSNVFHKLMVRTVGTRMIIWIDDHLMFTTTDPSLSTGVVGIRNQTATIDLDNVKLYDLSAFDSRSATH